MSSVRRRLGILVVAGSAMVGCSSRCDLTTSLSSLTGGAAKDCGHVTLGADASVVDACVVSAFENQTPFVAQYDRQGTDSKVVFGIAGDAHGTVTFLLWDGDPSGGSGADPVVSGDACVAPAVSSDPARDPALTPPLTCGSTSSLGRTCG